MRGKATPKEIRDKVVTLSKAGRPTREIAADLDISPRTIRHLKRVPPGKHPPEKRIGGISNQWLLHVKYLVIMFPFCSCDKIAEFYSNHIYFISEEMVLRALRNYKISKKERFSQFCKLILDDKLYAATFNALRLYEKDRMHDAIKLLSLSRTNKVKHLLSICMSNDSITYSAAANLAGLPRSTAHRLVLAARMALMPRGR